MDTWVITARDIATMLELAGRDAVMDRVIDRVHDGMVDVGEGRRELSPLRGGFARDEPAAGVWEWMPHRHAGDSITLKAVAYSPANPATFGLPTILGTVLRFDDATGALTALSDGVLLTAIRTGAASAVAARLLAHPDSTVVGLIGAGAQAVTQLHGLCRVRPVRRVLVHDIDPTRAASFVRRAAFLGLEIEVASASRIASESDIVATATSVPVGDGPVLPDVSGREHLHVNAVGSDLQGKTELSPGLLRRAVVVPDHPEQCRREGELQQCSEAETGPSLAQLCAQPDHASALQGRPTVFDSTGMALEDHLAMEVLLEIAAEHDLGRRLQLEHHPSDHLDPYSFPPESVPTGRDRPLTTPPRTTTAVVGGRSLAKELR